LSARNVLNGKIVFEPVDYISEETYRNLSRRLELRSGDVLLTCSGSVGRSAVVGAGMRFALVRSVAVLRPSVMNGRFLSLALRSPLLQEQISRRKTETAQANIFQAQIRRLTVPVPPLEEQEEIVGRVIQLSALNESIKRRIAAALRNLERSSHAALAKAFRGELPTAEP
jgi:type I restriction enzyme S subunit